MKKFYFLLVLGCVFLFFSQSQSQNLFSFQNSPLDTVPCNSPCITEFVQHPDVRETGSYTVASIPYTPVTMISPTTVVLQDDTFSNALPIGFNFNFYGYQFDSLYIGSNGCLTFNSIYANQSCSYDTQDSLPYHDSKFPDNAIFLPFVDLDVSKGGSIRYATVGQFPNRQCIIEYNSIPFFDTLCNSYTCTFQCVLNEFYNTIQVYVLNKPLCTTDPLNHLSYATIGIQNIGHTSYLTPPNRNATIWSTSTEGWNFKPNGPPAYFVQYFDDTLQLISSGADSVTFCSSHYPRDVYAKINYQYANMEFWDTIKLVKYFPQIDSVIRTPEDCGMSNGTMTIYGSGFYPPFQYSINVTSFSNSNYFSGLPENWYFVTIKDALGCSFTDEYKIFSSSNLSLNITSFQNPLCPLHNGIICDSVSGGTPPYTFNYPALDTTNCLTNLYSGIYTIVVTDAVGCTAYTTIELVDMNGPVISEQISNIVCHQNGLIDISVNGGFPPYIYNWSTSATSQDLSGITQPGYYSVTVTDSALCKAKKFYLIKDTLVTKATSILGSPTTCGQSNGVLAASGSDGISPYTYLWSSGDTNAVFTGVTGGATYTCIVTDANNCSSSTSIFMPSSLALLLQVYGTPVHCNQPNSGFAYCAIQNAVMPVTYLWNTGNTNDQIANIDTGLYSVMITDSLGCTANDSVWISEVSTPIIQTITVEEPRCFGDSNGSIYFLASGGQSPYKYSIDDTIYHVNSNFTNLSAGSHTLYVLDHNGCTDTITMNINEPSALQLDSIITEPKSCLADSSMGFQLFVSGATPPYLYRINQGAWQNSNTFHNIPGGDYWIEIKDSNQCSLAFQYQLLDQEPLPPVIQVEKKDLICYQIHSGEIAISLEGGWPPYSYHWDPSQSNSLLLQDLYPGDYHFFVTDAKGCSSDTMITLKQLSCCDIIMPTAFSPNGDGLNDVFKPVQSPDIGSDIKMLIYNRWGQQVFQSFSINSGWDGNIHGVATENETYFYLIYYDCLVTKRRLMKAGDFIMVR